MQSDLFRRVNDLIRFMFFGVNLLVRFFCSQARARARTWAGARAPPGRCQNRRRCGTSPGRRKCRSVRPVKSPVRERSWGNQGIAGCW